MNTNITMPYPDARYATTERTGWIRLDFTPWQWKPEPGDTR